VNQNEIYFRLSPKRRKQSWPYYCVGLSCIQKNATGGKSCPNQERQSRNTGGERRRRVICRKRGRFVPLGERPKHGRYVGPNANRAFGVPGKNAKTGKFNPDDCRGNDEFDA